MYVCARDDTSSFAFLNNLCDHYCDDDVVKHVFMALQNFKILWKLLNFEVFRVFELGWCFVSQIKDNDSSKYVEYLGKVRCLYNIYNNDSLTPDTLFNE